MTFDQLGNVGEVVGAVAVVISLVYLASQLRHSTQTVRAATHQSIVAAAAACNATISTHKELARIFRIGSEDPESLDEDERVQFAFLCSQLFDIFENLYLQRSYETLDDDFWLPRSRAYLGLLLLPGIRRCWNERKDDYSGSFLRWVEAQKGSVGSHEEAMRRLFLSNADV